ncbi:hypothetical protein KCV07_g331, partial [Aureobasidium melanogenum]
MKQSSPCVRETLYNIQVFLRHIQIGGKVLIERVNRTKRVSFSSQEVRGQADAAEAIIDNPAFLRSPGFERELLASLSFSTIDIMQVCIAAAIDQLSRTSLVAHYLHEEQDDYDHSQPSNRCIPPPNCSHIKWRYELRG